MRKLAQVEKQAIFEVVLITTWVLFFGMGFAAFIKILFFTK